MFNESLLSPESKISNGNYNPDSEDVYEYKLTLACDNSIKKYKKFTKNKYCKLLNNNNLILSELTYFEIDIKYKNNDLNKINVKHYFDKTELEFDDYYVYKDDNIYIEFIKKNDYIECCCYVKKLKSDLLMFFTPPNY